MTDLNKTIFDWEHLEALKVSSMTEEATAKLTLWSCLQDGFWVAAVSNGKGVYTGKARQRDRAVAFALRELSNHILMSVKPEYP